MFIWKTENAAKTAIDLAEENIKSTSTWVSPEQVISFVDEIYNYLTASDDSGE